MAQGLVRVDTAQLSHEYASVDRGAGKVYPFTTYCVLDERNGGGKAKQKSE